MADEPMTDCTGAYTCAAPIHIHGCFADWTGVRCDAPEEHRVPSVGHDEAHKQFLK